MSLEASIAELNTNIVALISVMSGANAPAQPAKKAPKTAPAAALVAATSPTTDAAPAPQPAAAPTPPATAAAQPAVTIEAARAVVIELGQKKGREAVMALLGKFGASKLPEVQPHLYAAIVADGQAALAA